VGKKRIIVGKVYDGDNSRGSLAAECFPNLDVDAKMQAAQRGALMEKQPNSRMGSVCGIDNPIGLHVHFYTDDRERYIAGSSPSQRTKAIRDTCTEASSRRYWTSQLKFLYTLSLSWYD
jgi:hypothetical protein